MPVGDCQARLGRRPRHRSARKRAAGVRAALQGLHAPTATVLAAGDPRETPARNARGGNGPGLARHAVCPSVSILFPRFKTVSYCQALPAARDPALENPASDLMTGPPSSRTGPWSGVIHNPPMHPLDRDILQLPRSAPLALAPALRSRRMVAMGSSTIKEGGGAADAKSSGVLPSSSTALGLPPTCSRACNVSTAPMRAAACTAVRPHDRGRLGSCLSRAAPTSRPCRSSTGPCAVATGVRRGFRRRQETAPPRRACLPRQPGRRSTTGFSWRVPVFTW